MHVRQRRPQVTVALASVVAIGLTGCGSVGVDKGLTAAQVRFVEVSPGAHEMDFYVNGTGAAYGVGYESFTSYLPVNAGTATLSASKAGAEQTLVGAQSVLAGGHQYTAIVSHGLGSLQERIYLDQDVPAPAGQVAVRLLNEVEGTGALAVHVTAAGSRTAVVAASVTVASGGSSSYLLLPASAEYLITAVQADRSIAPALANVDLKVGVGDVRTVVFAGTVQSGHANVVGFTLPDADGAER